MNKRAEKQKIGGEFKHLQIKLFVRTTVIMVCSVIATYIILSLLSGHFADFVVTVVNFFTDDYYQALNIYQQYVRNYFDLYLLLAVLGIFLIAFPIYLRGFTRYFNEINRGIDALIDEDAGEVSLSSELNAVEKKINYIKHSLEQQKLETELAEQRKNDLVIYLAHDLKTPLTSVIGYLTLLRDENQISEELRTKYLSISLEKAERLEDLINEFFEITRFNLSDITLEYSRVNLTRLLEQLTYEFRPMFLEKNLTCELDIAPDMMITCDVDKMQRVFDNLLRNAVNYAYNDTAVRIAVTSGEDRLSVKFTNCGNTIPQEKLERIFEQFFRLDAARSSRSGGAGLGLAIAKEIVGLHRGSITAKSDDGIIEFEVTLPVL